IVTDKVFVVTDDEGGVATALTEALRNKGGRTVLVRFGPQGITRDQEIYTANLADPTVVCDLLETIRRQQGRIAGIVHLLPLTTGMAMQEMDMNSWRSRLELEVETLFCLAQAAVSDLRQSAASGGATLLAGTSMGGTFGDNIAGSLGPFLPSQGGVSGLI